MGKIKGRKAKILKKPNIRTKIPSRGRSIIEARKNPGSYRISCIVKPNARKNRIYTDELQIFVDITSPPIKGKANNAIIQLFHERLHIPKSHIQLVKGQTSHNKMFQILGPNLTCDEIWQRLTQNNE